MINRVRRQDKDDILNLTTGKNDVTEMTITYQEKNATHEEMTYKQNKIKYFAKQVVSLIQSQQQVLLQTENMTKNITSFFITFKRLVCAQNMTQQS